jgi:hypothetical protein
LKVGKESKNKNKLEEKAMRRILFLLGIVVLFVSSTGLGQVLLIEHFPYANTDEFTSGGWTIHSGTTDMVIKSGSLGYPGYMVGEGNRIELSESRTVDRGKDLDQSYSDGAIYCSFLLYVTGAPSGSGTYFLHFFQGTSGSTFGGSVWIRQSGSGFQLGVNVRTTATNTQWASATLSYNQTYLVVVKYEFVSGSSNDVAKLWINPDLSGPEPTPDAVHVNTGGIDLSNIGRVALRQSLSLSGDGMGTLEIDEIRIGRSWGDAPLPVQVASVLADVSGRDVRIKIKTQTEPDDFLGFNVYRSRDGENFVMVGSYESVSSLRAKSNIAYGGEYEFVDKGLNTGRYQYKIEAVSRSEKKFVGDVISVEVDVPKGYALHQNYPNPFNPVTVIEFEIPEAGYVLIELYNSVGQKVRDIFAGELPAGYHKVRFDASGLSSGVYFYRMSAGKFNAVRKMVIMK